MNNLNSNLTEISGGVCAAEGFSAYGIHCGLRKNTSKLDLALIKADCKCAAAGVYTTNKVFAAPVGVTRAHLSDGYAEAIICNSGNANACTPDGYEKANATCAALADALGIAEDDIIVASTGVIGMSLDTTPIISGIPTLIEKLDSTAKGSDKAALAIMTTDLKKKEYAFELEIGGKTVKIGGICKGSGMIHPNMGTMLCFITTDCAITPAALDSALRSAVHDTFNMVSVDGDTSTNDMVTVLASGKAENSIIDDTSSADYKAFASALYALSMKMALAIAADGEGATKLLRCTVSGAKTEDDARVLARSVIASSLVKTAMFGSDANWGRVICALGYSGADFDTSLVDIAFASSKGVIEVCKGGRTFPFDESVAKNILLENEVEILCNMNSGEAVATAFGCDLSYDYVTINGDYRS